MAKGVPKKDGSGGGVGNTGRGGCKTPKNPNRTARRR